MKKYVAILFSFLLGTMACLAYGQEIAPPPADTTKASEVVVEDIGADATQMRMLVLVNEHRARHGLFPLSPCREMMRIASAWAAQQAASGAMYHGGGEQVVAMNSGNADPIASAVQQWIASPAHNAWLLTRSTNAGFGAQPSRNGGWYFAGKFGDRVHRQTTTVLTYDVGSKSQTCAGGNCGQQVSAPATGGNCANGNCYGGASYGRGWFFGRRR